MRVTLASAALFVFYFCASTADAQQHHHHNNRSRAPHHPFYIPPQHRVVQPGACLWVTTESVARTLGHAGVAGIAAHKKATTDGGARQEDVRRELNSRGVKYVHSPYGTHDYAGLTRATNQGHGVIVGVQTRRHDPTPTSGHAILVVRASPSKTTFWNPSAPDRLGTVDAEEFKKDWFGDWLYILPPPPATSPAR